MPQYTDEYPVFEFVQDVPAVHVTCLLVEYWDVQAGADSLRGHLIQKLLTDERAIAAFAARLVLIAGADPTQEQLDDAFVEFDQRLSDREVEKLLDQSPRDISLYLQDRIRESV